MKRMLLPLIMLLFLTSALAQPHLAQEVIIDVTIASDIDVAVGPGGELKELTAQVFFAPTEGKRQEVLSQEVTPNQIATDPITIALDGSDSIRIQSRVRKLHIPHAIKESPAFPILSVPPEAAMYLETTENIDADNPAIKKLGQELADQSDDLYGVVFTIADWTRSHIQYNLSTLTADVAQPASWVLRERQGVCDELTSLFIALLRSQGIPARFISGISYTESPLFPDRWGAHGWAEVYFPDVGWVPFDVTYGQFGYVDAAHIKFRISQDATNAAIRYTWLGHDIKITPEKLRTSAELVSERGTFTDDLTIRIIPEETHVGFGSYNVLHVTVENRRDSYQAVHITLSQLAELTLDTDDMMLFLRPREKRKISFLAKVDESLDHGFVYSMPVGAFTAANSSDTTTFTAQADGPVFSEADMRALLETPRSQTSTIDVDCVPGKRVYYVDDVPEISCSITAQQDSNDVLFCVGTHCDAVNLRKGVSKTVEFILDDLQTGANKLKLSVDQEGAKSTSFSNIFIADYPEIAIHSVEAPATVRFDEVFTINATIEKISSSTPQNMTATLTGTTYPRTIAIPSLEMQREILFELEGLELSGPMTLSVNYQDTDGRTYNTTTTVTVDLVDLTFSQKFLKALYAVDAWIANLFS